MRIGDNGSPGDRRMLRLINRGLVVRNPLNSTSRVNCCWPSTIVYVSSIWLGAEPGLELHSKVALGNPFSKYCVVMVSRSVATLNSLNGCPTVELSFEMASDRSSWLAPVISSLDTNHCAPSLIVKKTAISPVFPL